MEGEWAWKISFLGPEVGYVSTQGPAKSGTVLKTEDGGKTWEQVTLGQSINRFRFLRPDLGFASGRRVSVFR